MARMLFAGLVLFLAFPIRAAVTVGFATGDITPTVGSDKPVYIAGYGQNRKATGVHDPLFVRVVVFESGGKKIALAALDVVGLQYPVVQRIRGNLADFTHILVASTHNHEGPDVIGLWGPSPRQSGVDPEYLAKVEQETVAAIRRADAARRPASASFGTANDSSLLRDSRQPIVYDDVARVLRIQDAETKRPLGIVMVFGCHPESLGSENTQITADFPHVTVKALEKAHGCPVVYFSGAVGGLMTTPREIIAKGKKYHEGNFEYCEVYGLAVARLAEKALRGAAPVDLEPFRVGVQPVALPLDNPAYHLMWYLGTLKRDAYRWSGNSFEVGEKATPGKPGKAALASEVNYVSLGDLDIVGIPGELYPELLFDRYQEPVDPAADFPDAPLEPAIVRQLPGRKLFYIGLANDEVGYIIPKRQWDWKPPYTYGSKDRHYGEVNSVGSEVAPILLQALAEAIKKAGTPSR